MQPLTKTLSTFSCLKIGVALMLSLAFSLPAAAQYEFGTSTSVDQNNYRPTVAVGTGFVSHDGWSCAIRDDKELMCWGTFSYMEHQIQGIPYLVGVSDVRTLSIAGWNVCAVTGAGKIYCSNKWGGVPQQITGIDNAVSALVTLTNYGFDCAVLSTGKVKCWTGGYGDYATAIEIPNLSDVVSLSWGGYFIYALTSKGTVYSFNQSTDIPQQIAGAKNVRQVSVNQDYVCLLLSSNKVYCADKSNAVDFASYVEVAGIDDAQLISMNGTGTCVTDSDTAVKCFRLKSLYSCILSGDWNVCTPITSGYGSANSGYMSTLQGDVAQLNAGMRHSCAVDSHYAVSCMHHGIPKSDCDIGLSGAACHTVETTTVDAIPTPNINLYGELGVSPSTPTSPGIWYTLPNFTAYKAGKPTMFTAPSHLTRYTTRSSTSISIAWLKVVNDTSSDFDVRYRVAGTSSWKTASGRITNASGDRLVTAISGLTPNTSYEIKVRGKNWASYTDYSSVLTTSTLP